MTDKALWNLIQKNDRIAYKDVFDLYYKPLCFYTQQFTKHLPQAEDIVQEIFIKLWDRRHVINIKTSLKAYLYQSAHNAYMNAFRDNKQKDKLIHALKNEALSYELKEDDELIQQKIEKVKNLVEKLPAKCKEILLLSKMDGHKNKDIALKLGISIKTVETQLSIAFKK